MRVETVPEKVALINDYRSPLRDDYIERYLAEARAGTRRLHLSATVDGAAAYWDADHSGQLEPGEDSIPGLTLTLLGMNGETVETLTTDEAGFFESSPLVPDQYSIAVSLEEDCILAGGRQQSLTDWALDIRPVSGERKQHVRI